MKKPDLFAEQRFLGERPVDDTSAEKLDDIRQSNAEILERYPAKAMKIAVEAKLELARLGPSRDPGRTRILRPSFTKRRYLASAAAACCVLAFAMLAVNHGNFTRFLSGNTDGNGSLSTATEIRMKGAGARLFVYKQNGTEALLLDNNAQVKPDDIVQLSYVAGGDKYGAIISVDGTGVVTQHYPDFGDMLARLMPTGEILLDFSYQLDNAPGFERFFFVTGSTVFSTTFFKEALSAAAKNSPDGKFAIPDELSPKAHVTDILLIK